MSADPNASATEAILAGGGEMGALMRATDWSRTPLGPLDGWPQSLKTAVSICLASRFPILIWWGRDLVKLYNDAYRPILGSKHPRALGQEGRECWAEIWHIIGPMLEGVIARGEATWSDDQMLPLNRHGFTEECYFTFTYSPIRDESGGVGGVFCAVIETTDRVLAVRRQAVLRELAAKAATARERGEACRAVTDTFAANPQDVPVSAIYLLDEAGQRLTLAGGHGLQGDQWPATVALDGAPGDALEAEMIRAALDARPATLDDAHRRVPRLAAGASSEPTRTVLVVPVARPGHARPYGVLVAGTSPRRPFDDAYRSFLELAAGQIGVAVSNAQAREDERRRAEQLAEIDRAKTVFFTNVSHEFRTPLALMVGPLEQLLDGGPGPLTPAQQRELALAHRNSRRLLKLVNTLLDFSRIEAGRIAATFEPVDLSQVTADLASVFRAAIEHAGLGLVVDCPPLPAPVYVDREMWEKVVLNLLSNALKFTFEGEIAVRLAWHGDRATLRVSDTGIGIAPDERATLFARFHRIRGARARTHEGSGIGLALVQELVRLHGGTIGVESAVDRGTTFVVTLPAGSAHLPPDRVHHAPALTTTPVDVAAYVNEAIGWASQEAGPPVIDDRAAGGLRDAEAARPAHTRERIVLADDNADMRQYLRRLLEPRWQVEAVANGDAALRAIREAPPALVLSDVMMPGLDGFALLRELRADPRTEDVPVVLLSARAGEEARIEGREAGADDYLVKPFSARELIARVESQLRLRRARRDASLRLHRTQARLESALKAGLAGTFYWDVGADRIITDENMVRYFSLSPAAVDQGVPLAEALPAIHEDDRARVERALAEAIAGSGQYEVEYRVRHSDGSLRWLSARGMVERDAEGAIGLPGFAVDVTERRLAEQALRASEERYRAIVESQAEMVCRFRPDGTILFVNSAYARARGTVPEALVGAGFWQFVDEADRPAVRATLDQLSPATPELRIENRFETAAGVCWTLWTNRALAFDAAGRATEVQSTGIDITERKQRERSAALLADLGRELAKLSDAGEMMRAVAATVCGHLEVTRCLFTRIDAERQRATVVHDGPVAGRASLVGDYRLADYFTPEATASLAAGTQLAIADVAADPRIAAGLERFTALDIRALVSTPYVSDGRWHASLTVHDHRVRVWTAAERALLGEVAGRTWAAIERVRAQAALRESEARLRALLAASSDAVYRMNADWTEMRQLSGRDFIADTSEPSRSWRDAYIHPDDQPRVDAAIARAIRTRSVFELEHRVRRADGTLGWTLSRAVPILDDRGEVVEWFGAASDVTRRKQAEALVARTQQTYVQLVEQAPFGIYIVDAALRIAHMNIGSQQGTFRNVRPVIGRDFPEAMHILWPAPVADGIVAEFRRTLATGEPYFSPGLTEPRSDIDAVESYEWQLHRITLPDGGAGVVCYYYDATRLRQAEQALRDADRRKDEFLATLAHELRNPLAPIRTGLELIRLAGNTPAAVERVRAMMERQVTHMVRLIDDLLDVSRITSGKIQLQRQRTPLATLVQGAVEATRAVMAANHVQLTVTLPPTDCLVDGDPTRLVQVLSNLLHNAAKFTPAGGHVRVTGEVRDAGGGHELALTVADTGVGIAPEMLPRIFDLFSQEHHDGRADGGLGIGLALARRLVEMHGGRIEARSPGRNQGTEIAVHLPVLAGTAAADPQGERARPQAGGRRVLVVDDNADAAASLAMLVEALGSEATLAHDGHAALARLAQCRPHVVLLDIGLPGLDGYETCRRMRDEPAGRDAIIVAITGRGQEHDKQRAAEAGFDVHLTKPADPVVLGRLLVEAERHF